MLTAVELCRRGASCYLVPLNLADREIWALAPDFVLLTYLRAVNGALAIAMAEAGIAFGVLDTEGGVWAGPEDYAGLLRPVASALARASCACIWGPRMADYLRGQRLYSERQISVTGCPRFDFYAPRWRSVLACGHPGGAPMILINTNFTTVNSRFASTEQNLKLHLRLGLPQQKIAAMIEAETEAIRATIDLARKLALRFPGAEVVLRPHPFERASTYGDAGVPINDSGPVQPQILRARAVIQRSCSTGIEAGLASVPALSPQWIPPYELIPMAESVSVPCASWPELAEAVEAVLSGRFQVPEAVRQASECVVRDWFYANDGQAHQRVADAVWRHRGAPDRRACSRNLYRARNETGRKRTSAHIRRLLHLSPDWSFSRMKTVPADGWKATTKYFGVAEVERLLAAIARAEGGSAPMPRATAVRGTGAYLCNYRGHAVKLAL